MLSSRGPFPLALSSFSDTSSSQQLISVLSAWPKEMFTYSTYLVVDADGHRHTELRVKSHRPVMFWPLIFRVYSISNLFFCSFFALYLIRSWASLSAELFSECFLYWSSFYSSFCQSLGYKPILLSKLMIPLFLPLEFWPIVISIKLKDIWKSVESGRLLISTTAKSNAMFFYEYLHYLRSQGTHKMVTTSKESVRLRFKPLRMIFSKTENSPLPTVVWSVIYWNFLWSLIWSSWPRHLRAKLYLRDSSKRMK